MKRKTGVEGVGGGGDGVVSYTQTQIFFFQCMVWGSQEKECPTLVMAPDKAGERLTSLIITYVNLYCNITSVAKANEANTWLSQSIDDLFVEP